MDHSTILQNVARHIQLETAEEGYFISLLKKKSIKRRDFLLREHDICLHSAFVTKGCLRGYTIDSNGFEHILQFAPPDWWIADMYSLIAQKPGHLVIDAIELTEVWLLSRKDQEKLFGQVPKFERFFRILTENSLVANRRRVLDNMTLSALERYEGFCTYYPTLIERLPQKLIAAYIGVTPEFLSKVKADHQKRERPIS